MPLLQIREVGAGTFAFVELAVDSTTGEEVAIKYLERGPKVLHDTVPNTAAIC